MGTTAEKLTYLNDTKGLLKDSINSLGGNITSQTTFRNYVTELDSIYSNLPKVSGTGSILSLNPTLKGRLGSVLKGNTLQDGTPTPDSPVAIQSATGLQNITVCGKNLFDKDNYTIKDSTATWIPTETGGTYSNTGTFGNGVTWRFELDTTKEYTFKANGFTNNVYCYIRTYTDNTYATTKTNVLNDGSGNILKTFQPDSKYVSILFRNNSSTSNVSISNIQLEVGTTATEYEPYQSQTKELNLGKNLLQTTQESYTFSANIDNSRQPVMGTIYLESNTKYYISYNVDTATTSNTRNTPYLQIGTTIIYQDSGTNKNLTTGRKVWEYTPSVSGTYSFGYWSHTPNVDLTVSKFMISTSSNTTYSPYFTPIKLNKIGDYQDYITGTPDNWVIKRQITEHTITNSDITLISPYWLSTHGVYGAGILKSVLGLISDNKDRNSFCSVSKKINAIASINENTYIFNGNTSYVFFFSSEFDTVEKAREKLNNATLYYNLDTETTEAITNQEIINQLNEIYNLQSYNGTTNITITSEDLELIMTASAIKGEA